MKTTITQSPILKPLIKSDNKFRVVGIGASAGGLAAFQKLLKAIPEKSGIAYVLVQHLEPSRESILPELLQKSTPIPVIEITDGIKVEPDHIYIIPSNKMLIANDGVLELSPRPPGKSYRNMPIDLFFASLAEVHQAYAIGVVLSGTASDGTLGLQAIKECGGITFAQDEASSAFKDMPHNAALAGVVDFIIPPEKIVGKIIKVIGSYDRIGADDSQEPHQDDELFSQILSVIQKNQGTDFGGYQASVIRNRVHRRMAVNESETPLTYLNFLNKDATERELLYKDLLIPVNRFFKDKKVFDYLNKTVFPTLLKNKSPKEPLRIWVAGCTTGVEAFSIAICIFEFLNKTSKTDSDQEATGGENVQRVQIFATDISKPAIAKARAGIYTKTEMAGLSDDRILHFFSKTVGGYQANKFIRDICVFAHHNFLKDMPYAKMDFISCRDVLIYMQPSEQEKAVSAFHYALNSSGFLLTGKSDNYPGIGELFTPTDDFDRLFTRNNVPSTYNFNPINKVDKDSDKAGIQPGKANLPTSLKKAADDIILSKYTPAGIVVNEAMDIVQFRGHTSLYLEQAPGKPSHNLMQMAKNGLAFELRNLLTKVKKENIPVIKENIPLFLNESRHQVAIEVIPLPNVIDPHYLILFHDYPESVKKQRKNSQKETSETGQLNETLDRVKQLEAEQAQTREDMHNATENQESAFEELQAANEELMSGSEELQSLNEELETSKEELQRINEELSEVNEELVGLNDKLTVARNYTEAIIATVRVPLLVLDKNFRIKTANRSFYKTFMVNESETEGALIYELGNQQWNIPKLHTLLEEILPEKNTFSDYEVTHLFPEIGERVMLLNASEIKRDEEEDEKLILLSIQDITEKAQAHKKEMEFQKHLEVSVVERTTELNLANELLQQKNRELEIANTELASFSYVSSHDLQEPLRKIKTFATLLLEKEKNNLSESGKDYVTRMQNAAKRMQALIEDLLAYSHTNTKEVKLELTSLDKIVAEVKNELSESIKEKDAIIETNKLCVARIVPFQFRQLFNNLISNSLKFTPAGIKPHIIIKTETVKGNEAGIELPMPQINYCHISVSDNGIGFSPEYKDKIFEIFQRLNGKDEFPGTGIGLAIVKKIVENHKGTITATGVLGKSATFDIYLPSN